LHHLIQAYIRLDTFYCTADVQNSVHEYRLHQNDENMSVNGLLKSIIAHRNNTLTINYINIEESLFNIEEKKEDGVVNWSKINYNYC